MRRVMLMTPCCPYVVDIIILHQSMMVACHYRATLSSIAGHRQIHVSVRLRYDEPECGVSDVGVFPSNPNQDNENENEKAKPGTVSPRKKDTKASKKIIFLNEDIINITRSKADLCQF